MNAWCVFYRCVQVWMLNSLGRTPFDLAYYQYTKELLVRAYHATPPPAATPYTNQSRVHNTKCRRFRAIRPERWTHQTSRTRTYVRAQAKHMRQFSEGKSGTLVKKYLTARTNAKGVFSVMDKIGEAARKGDINFVRVRTNASVGVFAGVPCCLPSAVLLCAVQFMRPPCTP